MIAWLKSLSGLQLTLLGLGTTVVMLLGSILVTGAVLVRLPADYFVREPRVEPRTAAWLLRKIGKNVLGLALVALGIVLSVPGVPGQGVLTILFGLMLMDFPGKRRLEQAIVRRPAVHRTIDRLRGRYGKPPLELPPESGSGGGWHP